MGDKPQANDVGVAEPPTDDELAEQLRVSRAVRADAEAKRERADETAGEMSRVLRRIAAAMDRNPQSWDALFDGRRE